MHDLDDLSPATLRATLRTAHFGHAHEHHATLGSTNDRMAQWLEEGAPAGALVSADAQEAGRGRMGRSWESSSPEIYASLGLRPLLGPAVRASFGALALVVGLALAEAIEASAPSVRIGLKWPNDLILEDAEDRAGATDLRKLGGVLCESKWMGSALELVIGFGINVTRTSFPDALTHSAVSLAGLLGAARPGRAQVLAHALLRLEERLLPFFAAGFGPQARDYEARCVSLRRPLWLPRTRPDGREDRILVEPLGLEGDGALRVRSAGGGAPFRVDSSDLWLTRGGFAT